MGEDKLKLCPFCGSDNVKLRAIDPEFLVVTCDVCNADGGYSDAADTSTREEAIAAWNTRSEGLQPPVVEVDEKVFSSLGASRAPSSASAGVDETPSGGWQDISTAPKDGTPILAFCVHANARYAGEDFSRWTEIVRTRWIDFNGGGWTWNGICGVLTHWRPLPAPPTDCQTSGGEA